MRKACLLKKSASVVLVIAALCGLVLSGCTGIRPQEIAIADIYKDPKRYDGKVLRVRGIFDQCVSLSCNLCDGTSERHCLRPVFEVQPGQSTTHVDSAVEQVDEYLYRFATVTAEGRYDFTCDRASYEPASGKGGSDEIVVCTDRAPNFFISSIAAVHERSSAADGRYTSYLGGPLHLARSDWVAQIVEIFDSSEMGQYWHLKTEKRGERFEIFEGHDEIEKDKERVTLCVCRDADCSKHWPQRSGQTLQSPANPYLCADAQRIKGEWRFPPHLL